MLVPEQLLCQLLSEHHNLLNPAILCPLEPSHTTHATFDLDSPNFSAGATILPKQSIVNGRKQPAVTG